MKELNNKLPTALWRFFKKKYEESSFAMRNVVMPSAVLILIFAHISNVEACITMPLVYCHDTIEFRDRFIRDLYKWDWKATIPITEDDWFNQICKLLIGARFLDQSPTNQSRAFLVSEYGWSVYFMNVGDLDPSQVELNLICIRKGVPLSTKTNERKYRILDAPPIIDATPPNAPGCPTN
jgi:hypothetical protein